MSAPSAIMTTPTDVIEIDPLLLYEPITSQVNVRKIPYVVDYVRVTPTQAQAWLDAADEYDEFGQRRRTEPRIKRWHDLMASSRFVEFLPNGPLCFNAAGILMNGGNRLAAVARYGKPVGFVVFQNVPDWMMSFFDTGNNRSLKESLDIAMKREKIDAAHSQIARLALRYEEFIFGKRGQLGWVEWARHKDEHIDIINWLHKRTFVTDFTKEAKIMRSKGNMQLASAACFLAFQQLAWPEGQDKVQEFVDGVCFGVMLEKGNPALTLREWFQKDGFIGGYTHGRREGHLLLLFQAFMNFCENNPMHHIRVAKGLPMQMPYHPHGWEVACKNVRDGLLDLEN